MKTFRSALIALTFATAMPAIAGDQSSGCGPAWYIFKENSLVSSALRMTTNGILFPLVTLGMTFGTSNCSQHKIVDADKRPEHLATVGFERLRQDAAQGDGEFLEAYSQTFACGADAAPAFKELLRKNYDVVFPADATPSSVVGETRRLMKNDQALSRGCGAV